MLLWLLLIMFFQYILSSAFILIAVHWRDGNVLPLVETFALNYYNLYYGLIILACIFASQYAIFWVLKAAQDPKTWSFLLIILNISFSVSLCIFFVSLCSSFICDPLVRYLSLPHDALNGRPSMLLMPYSEVDEDDPRFMYDSHPSLSHCMATTSYAVEGQKMVWVSLLSFLLSMATSIWAGGLMQMFSRTWTADFWNPLHSTSLCLCVSLIFHSMSWIVFNGGLWDWRAVLSCLFSFMMSSFSSISFFIFGSLHLHQIQDKRDWRDLTVLISMLNTHSFSVIDAALNAVASPNLPL